MKKNQDKGFTLVELLIVIVILGILATVTVFAVRGITSQGQDNACAIEARTLDSAIEAYYAQEFVDPPNEAALVPAYLRDAPDSDNWTFVSVDGPDGIAGNADDIGAATYVPVTAAAGGACEGF
ncbi:MAG: type II secretion system protein [Ilumatobacter sp.]|jgi:prepilin-type N-terminal cleavage/methylation domain-containing protein|uniref:type II secretion system protein n=1 Tax=Ilumatobacter sp. TaxID=1967498 RepID=UPI00391BB6A9